MKEPQSGIYVIVNTITGDFYIGSSVNLRKREAHHFSRLRLGRHGNFRLQRSYNKYGRAAFVFEPIAILLPNEIACAETRLLSRLWGHRSCLNLKPVAVGRGHGFRHSAETRAKIAAANTGKRRSPESIMAMSLARKGRPVRLTAEQQAYRLSRLREAKTGQSMPAATRAKISAANKGRRPSRETIAKLVAANRSRAYAPFSSEHRAKLRAARKRWSFTSEQIALRNDAIRATYVRKKLQESGGKNSRLLSAFGETKPMAAWARDAGCLVGAVTLKSRLRMGWTVERAITQAPQIHKRRA